MFGTLNLFTVNVHCFLSLGDNVKQGHLMSGYSPVPFGAASYFGGLQKSLSSNSTKVLTMKILGDVKHYSAES